MPEYVQQTQWKEKALALLPSFFKQQLNPKSLQSYIEIFAEELQSIEDQLPLIAAQNNVMTATGVHLDRFGQLLGVTRDGNTDEVYRALLLAKVVSNRSTGVINDVYNIMSILGDTTPLTSDYYPATFLLQSLQSKIPYLTPDLLLKIIRGASLPINLEVSFSSDTPFGFDDNPNAYGFGVGEFAEKGAEPYFKPLDIPANLTEGLVTFDTIAIEWDSVEYATSYIVRVYDNTDDVLVLYENVGNVLNYTIVDLIAGHEYDIRVKAVRT